MRENARVFGSLLRSIGEGRAAPGAQTAVDATGAAALSGADGSPASEEPKT